MTRLILKFLLIFKTPKATFKGVQIKSEGGAGRPLGQDALFTKIWPTAINTLDKNIFYKSFFWTFHIMLSILTWKSRFFLHDRKAYEFKFYEFS